MIFVYGVRWVQFRSFACVYPFFLIQFIEETFIYWINFPHCVFWHPCQRSVDCICVGLFLGSLYVLFHCPYISFMPVPYCSFLIYFEMRECDASRFVFLFKIALAFRVFVFYMNLRIIFSASVKKMSLGFLYGFHCNCRSLWVEWIF